MSIDHATDMNATARPGFTFDQHVLTGLIVLIASLPFLLGNQQMSLVSIDSIGIGANSMEGDHVKQMVLVGVYAASGLLLIKRTRLSESLAATGVPLLALLALALLSVAWADLPSVVFRRSVALAGTFCVGLYAGMRLDEREMLHVLIRSIWIVLLLSFVVAAVFPESGLDPEGRLRGVTAHKNGLGAIAALGLLVMAASLYDPQRAKAPVMRLGFVALCVITLALSGSATPLPVLVFALLVLVTAQAAAPRSGVPSLLVVAALIVGLLVPLFVEDLGAIAALFGRSSDFSGRNLVWAYSLEMLQRKLAFGWGFGEFWNGEAGMAFVRWSHFAVANAHNGFVQLALDTGLAGVLLFTASLLTFASRARALLKTDPCFGSGFAFAYVAFFLAGNVTESRLLAGNEVPITMLFVFLVVRVNLRFRHLANPEVSDLAPPLAARRAK